MSIFGDLERAFVDLYPYRWAFAAGISVFLAVLTGYAYRQGWHSIFWRRRGQGKHDCYASVDGYIVAGVPPWIIPVH